MTTLTIQELDTEVEKRVRDCAARHGHSIEEAERRILQTATRSAEDEPKNAYEAMRRHPRDLEGVVDSNIRLVPHDRNASRLGLPGLCGELVFLPLLHFQPCLP